MLVQALLHLLLPGQRVPGVRLANGRRLRYKLTGAVRASAPRPGAHPAAQGTSNSSAPAVPVHVMSSQHVLGRASCMFVNAARGGRSLI